MARFSPNKRSGLLALCSLLLACSPGAAAIDYKSEILPIMRQYCFDCHSGSESKGNLDLANIEEVRDYQVGKYNIIRPGDPGESSFLEKLHLPESHRDFMPRRGTRLPDDLLARIAEWIEKGAVIDAENPTDDEKAWVAKLTTETGPDSGSTDYLTWTSNDGKEIEARFYGIHGDSVKLVMRNGTSYLVPLARLSVESAAEARKLASR